jgi:hypothetical protein
MRINLKPEPQLLRLARIAGQFARYRVEYCVIGGYATAMYLPHRRPDDIDVVIAPSLRTGKRAAAAIASLALELPAGTSTPGLLPDPQSLADGEQLVLDTPHGTLHLLGAHLPSGCDRAAIIRRRRWLIMGRYPVAICRLDDLLSIKQAANHRHDAADVAELLAAYPRLT